MNETKDVFVDLIGAIMTEINEFHDWAMFLDDIKYIKALEFSRLCLDMLVQAKSDLCGVITLEQSLAFEGIENSMS